MPMEGQCAVNSQRAMFGVCMRWWVQLCVCVTVGTAVCLCDGRYSLVFVRRWVQLSIGNCFWKAGNHFKCF